MLACGGSDLKAGVSVGENKLKKGGGCGGMLPSKHHVTSARSANDVEVRPKQ